MLTEGMDYLKWKREVGIWELGTSIAADKKAAVCVLRIQDFKARDFATRLDVTELKKAEGMTYLMAELDKYFEEDNTQSIFLGIDDLEKFVRPEQMQMTEYIAEFKRRLNRIGELFDDKKDIYIMIDFHSVYRGVYILFEFHFCRIEFFYRFNVMIDF